MDRRRVLILGVGALTPPLLSGCASSTDKCLTGTELDKSICRQHLIQEQLPGQMTAAMIIGASLGLAAFIALRANPVVGILGGALIAGGITAVQKYIEYCNEQANGDRLQAQQIFRDSVTRDKGFASESKQNCQVAVSSAKQALQNKTHNLYQSSNQFKDAKELVNQTQIAARTFFSATSVYTQSAPKLDLADDPIVRASIPSIQSDSTAIRDISVAFAADLEVAYRG